MAKDKAPPRELPPESPGYWLPGSGNLIDKALGMQQDLAFLDQEWTKIRENGDIVDMARAFVVAHRLQSFIDEAAKAYNKLFELYKTKYMPEALEAAGVTHVPLSEGFRIGMSARTWASVNKDQRDAAYEWLRNNGLGDLIQPTINASTLSAAAKAMLEENRELPEDLFKVAVVPTTSVTATK